MKLINLPKGFKIPYISQSFLICFVLLIISCNDSGTTKNESTKQDTLVTKKDSSAVKPAVKTPAQYPEFILKRDNHGAGKDFKHFYGLLHSEAFRFYYSPSDKKIYINGLEDEDNIDSQIDNFDTELPATGSISVETPNYINALTLNKFQIKEILTKYPHFMTLSFTPISVIIDSELAGKISQFTTSKTYLSYQVVIDGQATGLKLNPNPPGHTAMYLNSTPIESK